VRRWHNLGYARISTADQDPQLQLDALAVADCLKIYTDTASGTARGGRAGTAPLSHERLRETRVAIAGDANPKIITFQLPFG